jgi:hypothetical protein
MKYHSASDQTDFTGKLSRRQFAASSRQANVHLFAYRYEFMTIAAPEIVAVSSLHCMQR